jgi:N-acetylmuramoyl-L-alanine amidase
MADTGSAADLIIFAVVWRVLRTWLGPLAVVFSLGLGAGAAAAQEALPEVLASRVTTTPDRARLVVDLSATTTFAIVSLEAPARIAVDIRASGVAQVAAQPMAGKGIIQSFATAMAQAGRARVELALNIPAVVQQAYFLDAVGDQPARLVVDMIPTTPEDFAGRVAADRANAMARTVAEAVDGSEEPSAASVASSAPAPDASAASAPETRTAGGAEPSRPLIVLDPGHGGVDNGASTTAGIHEKDITLAFALQLRNRLVSSGHFDVALTRDDDSYLTLNDRVNLARQNQADLFISLHADTFQQPDIRGASIYTRDERATDVLDAVLADGENRSDIVAGFLPPDVQPAVVDILVDLMRRQMRQQAYLAAQDIVKAMEPSVTLRRFPVRQADFFVLQAPDIPSMLVELGFMSNAADIANLESDDWRNRVVEAIAKGVETYFADLKGTSP